MSSISAVIITLNEEVNISRAILSVKPWVDEVVVVDMMSDDRTAEIAVSLGSRLYEYPRVGFVEPARATAVDYAAGEWVLILDADEVISCSLGRELRQIAERDEADVCHLPRLNYVLGKPMFFGQHSPGRDVQVRFFKKGSLRFSDRIHSFPEPKTGARVYTVQFAGNRAIHHFHAATASQLIDKMNRYTTTEAEQILQECKRAAPWRLLLFPPVFFIQGYIFNQGWRDGWRGFYWASLMAFYRLTRETKHLQLFECGPTPAGEAPYSREVTELLHECNDSVSGYPSSHKVDANNAPGILR